MSGDVATVGDVAVRAMTPDDVPAVFGVAMRAFEFDLPTDPAALSALRRRWDGRTSHLAGTDPHGSLVAEHDGTIVAVSQAIVRERLWGLSLFVVAVERRGTGLGRRLLTLALAYGGDAPAGLIVSSTDPVAIRSYATAGFVLHPTVEAAGVVARNRLPALGDLVREGDTEDLPLTGPASRHARGASHEADIAQELRTGARLALCGERGFVLLRGSEVHMLAARDEEAARALLWWAMAEGGDQQLRVAWMTAAQRWAIEIVVRARLNVSPGGPLFVRGRPGPLAPYLPSGSYL